MVDYRTDPSRYRHWKLSFDGPVATLAIDVAEDAGIRPGYKLKLNSYDLGVDIELYDALNRIRFEHPEVRSVVVTSLKDRIFCSGANIFMLGLSTHAVESELLQVHERDAQRHRGREPAFRTQVRRGAQRFLRRRGLRARARVRRHRARRRSFVVGLAAGGSAARRPAGYRWLTRVTDKRRVRHDHADLFCTTTEGVRGKRALEWRLVDALAKPGEFDRVVRERAGTGCAKRPSHSREGHCASSTRTYEDGRRTRL